MVGARYRRDRAATGSVVGVACFLIACSSTLLCASAAPTCESKSYPTNGSITPVTFGTPLLKLNWLWGESSDQYVVAITDGVGACAGGEVWMSSDHGSNWKNLTSELDSLMDGEDPFRFLRGAVSVFHTFSPPSGDEPPKSKIFVQGAGRYNWVSTSFGEQWKRHDSPAKTIGYWTHYKMHPSEPDWMLALAPRHTCQWQSTIIDKWCASDLFVTQDFGETWRNLTAESNGRIASFVDFDWGTSLRPWDPDSKTARAKEVIFATAYEDPKHMKGPLPSWDQHIHYVTSDDFFKTPHEKIASCGNRFDIFSGKVYLAVPSNCPFHPDGSKRKLSAEEAVSPSVIMYVSDDEGTSFAEACIPAGDLDLGYQLHSIHSNSTDGGAFLVVDHGAQGMATSTAPISNIYSSGGGSSLFSLSLSRAFRKDGRVDFTPVDGLRGMYIANVLGLNVLEDAAFRWETDVTDFERYVQSFVSNNGGAHWKPIKSPAADSFNYPSCDSCSKTNGSIWECSLHLHGPSSWHASAGTMPSLHSHFSAPGIVMAVGNVGHYLDFAADSTCTFLSRDGGESWQDIATYANVFEFGDQGGILVMARHQTHGPATHVRFSLDEGRCWHHVNLSEPIDVAQIRVEPSLKSQVFLIEGQACQKSDWHPNCTHTEQGTAPAGKLYALDFEQILGSDWRVCNDSDYEIWAAPSDDRCLLGQKYTLTRRKQDSACFNGRGWERAENWQPCDCTELDLECEYGYERSSYHDNSTCIEMVGVNRDTCAAVKSGAYTISKTHKRLLSGDVCANVSALIPDTDGRGHSTLPRRRMWTKWAIVAVVVVVVGAVVAGTAHYMKRRTDPDSNTFSDGTGGLTAPLAAVGNAVGWMKAKITGRRRSDDEYFQPLTGADEDFGVDDEQDMRSPTRQP